MANPLGGQVKPYGNAISDALDDPKTSSETLEQLRRQARSLLEEQGDLPGALERLEAEIARRKGSGPQGAGGVGILYGVVICDALADPTSSLETLRDLRDKGRAQLAQHGNLSEALERLDAAIASRQG